MKLTINYLSSPHLAPEPGSIIKGQITFLKNVFKMIDAKSDRLN